ERSGGRARANPRPGSLHARTPSVVRLGSDRRPRCLRRLVSGHHPGLSLLPVKTVHGMRAGSPFFVPRRSLATDRYELRTVNYELRTRKPTERSVTMTTHPYLRAYLAGIFVP